MFLCVFKKKEKKIKNTTSKKKMKKVQLQRNITKKIQLKNTATKNEWPKNGVGERGGGAHRNKLSSVVA